jgi:nucleoside-diphosphate-sugar epimerase
MGMLGQNTGPVSFILGASGTTGQALVEELRAGPYAKGGRVIAHLREDQPRTPFLQRQFEDIGAEVWISPFSQEALAAALQEFKPSHLFILHGTTKSRAKAEGLKGDPYQTIDLGLTRIALSACAHLEDDPRVVYLSAQGTRQRSRSPYFRARFEAENAVRSSGLPYTIARAPLIHRAERMDPRPLERWSGSALNLLAGGLRTMGCTRRAAHIAPIEPHELARGLAHSAFNYTTLSRILEAEELRDERPIHRADPIPATRRDDARH